MVANPILQTVQMLGKKRFTVEYPAERESMPDNYRGIHRLDIKTCISCGACARICPNDTITMVEIETERGIKKMPEINLERCLFCGLCEEVCPPHCLTLTKNYDVTRIDRRDFIRRPEELD